MTENKLDFLEPHEKPHMDIPPKGEKPKLFLSQNDPMWRIVDELVSVNRANGFSWTAEDIPKALALIHSEASEALSEDRHRKEGWEMRFCTELADIVIRAFDLARNLNLPIETTICSKIVVNSERGYKHGNKRY